MRTVIDVDDELVERAAKELGTKTKKDTVNEALRLAAERQSRVADIFASDETGRLPDDALLSLGIGEDADNPQVMNGAGR